jgi:hypothetical protein
MWLNIYFLGMSWQYSFAYMNTNHFVRSTVNHVPVCATGGAYHTNELFSY